MLLLFVSIWTTPPRASESDDVVSLAPSQSLTDRLAIARPDRTWVAVDGGMVRPLRALPGLDPGLHDLLLLERDDRGGILTERWVSVDVQDPQASGQDAYPPTYLVDRKPPRLTVRQPPFIQPTDTLPVTAYDESGIRRVSYLADGETLDIHAPRAPWPVGRHTVVVQGEDRAGNVSERRLTFEVDDQAPEIVLTAGRRVAEEGDVLRIRGRGEVEAAARDDRSGVATLLFRIGEDRWRAVRGPIEVPDDGGFIEFEATDEAGNRRVLRREIAP